MQPQPPQLPPGGGKPSFASMVRGGGAARAGGSGFCTQCGGQLLNGVCGQCRPQNGGGGGGDMGAPAMPPPPAPFPPGDPAQGRPRARLEEKAVAGQPIEVDRGERVSEWNNATMAPRRRASEPAPPHGDVAPGGGAPKVHRNRSQSLLQPLQAAPRAPPTQPPPQAQSQSRRRRASAADAAAPHPPPPPLPPTEPPPGGGAGPRRRRHSEADGAMSAQLQTYSHFPPPQQQLQQQLQQPPHAAQVQASPLNPQAALAAAPHGVLPPVLAHSQLGARRASDPGPAGHAAAANAQWFGMMQAPPHPSGLPYHTGPHAPQPPMHGVGPYGSPAYPRGMPPMGAPAYPGGGPAYGAHGMNGSMSSVPHAAAGALQPYMPPAPPPPAAAPSAAAPGGVELGPLQAALDRFGVSIAEAEDLVCLADWDVVIIIDDSSSMRLAAEPAAQRRLDRPIPTRWDEMCSTLLLLVDVAAHFDRDGLDVYFLNQPPITSVRGSDDVRLRTVLGAGPKRGTPLTECMLTAVREHAAGDKCEKPGLLLIFTDGEPTGEGGVQGFVSAVGDVVKGRAVNGTYRIQILACTDDERSIAYLNELDTEYEEVDVTDDYYSELKEVQAAKRTNRFTRGDWAMKALLAPVSKKFDDWDEEGGGDDRAPLTTPTQKARYRGT